MPTELVLSKNRKKMDTAKSDTTRTDLSGCRLRTLDAINCTQTLSAMRWAMVINRVTNSATPECFGSLPSLPAFDPSVTLPRMALSNCLRTDVTDEGNAASNTVTARTMPMSSSSERCASCAASSSSLAIPNDTENARSDPREPSAPTVVMPPPPANPCYTATSAEIRSASSEIMVLEGVLASQSGLTLPLRRLLISPASDTKGRGGKARRERVGGTHHHKYSGCVFGCLLGPAVDFVRHTGSGSSELLHVLRSCLEPAAKDLVTCEGKDAALLQRGFASHHAIRGQLSHLNESKTTGRIKYTLGRKSAVLGVSVAVYFVLSALARNTSNSASLLLVTGSWLRRCHSMLRMWRTPLSVIGDGHHCALDAERRALDRAARGMERARSEFSLRGITDTYNQVRLVLECMRRAMWPAGKHLDAGSQGELCSWIESGDFMTNTAIRLEPKSRMEFTVNVPLSAVPRLDKDESDEGSACDSWSSSGSSRASLSSAGSEGGLNSEQLASLSQILSG